MSDLTAILARAPGIGRRSRRFESAIILFLTIGSAVLSGQEPPGAREGEAQAPRLRATKQVRPVYPAIAISADVQGVVKIEARIGPNGRVVDARVIESIPLLDNAALDAVRQWEFLPPQGGATFVATVTFVLSTAPVSPAVRSADAVGWPPSDFALYYRFECRDGFRQVGTGAFLDNGRAPFSLANAAGAPEYLSLLLIQEGFFSIPGAVTERSRAESTQVNAAGIDMTVAARRPHSDWPPTDSPTFHHELMVRTFGVWRILKWSEPVAAGDERGAESSRVGAAVRRFFRSLEEKGAASTAECR